MRKNDEIAEHDVDIFEICPDCGEENEYASTDIGESLLAKCRECGRWIVLCDRCEDHTKCVGCEWCKVARDRNAKEGLGTEDEE